MPPIVHPRRIFLSYRVGLGMRLHETARTMATAQHQPPPDAPMKEDNDNNSSQEWYYEKVSYWMKQYEDFVGLTEVKAAQAKVVEVREIWCSARKPNTR